MRNQLGKPKGFGEILDETFRLSKNRFFDFFKILLIVVGPVYLFQALIQALSGMSVFREAGEGGSWYEEIYNSLETGTAPAGIGTDLAMLLVGLAAFLLFPVAQAAVLLAVDRVQKQEEFTAESVIKQAFSRFFPILGSSLLFGIIVFGVIIVPVMLIFLVSLAGALGDVVASIIFGIVLFFAFLVLVALFLTKLSFYLASVVLDHDAPGLGRSWRLTKGQTWKMAGLYLVFYLIIGCISFATEGLFSIFLGNSVLFNLLVNLVTLFTTMILAIGYTIMYLDLKARNSADDLKEMIYAYKEEDR